MAKPLGEQVKTGYLWTLLGTGIGQPLSFVVGVVLARLLHPSDFGIIASCLLFTEIGATLVSSSFVSALIQRKEISPLDLSTGFVLQLAVGMATMALLIVASPLAGWFFSNDLVADVLSVLSVNMVLLAMISTPSVIARRNLNFRLLSIINLVDTLIYGFVSIACALAGYGVWSLVVGRIVSRVTQLVQISVATKWCPSVRFSKSVAASLLSIATQFAGKNILNDLTKKIDYLVVGWKLGVEPLGLYSRAAYLMTVPVDKFSTSLGMVLFPTFSKFQDDRVRLVHGLLKSTAIIAMTTFPILLGLSLIAQDLIVLVYGEKWLGSAAPLAIICLAGLFYSVDSSAVALIDAGGYLVDEIRRQFLHVAMLVGCVLFGAYWGLVGVAWGVVVAAFGYWCLVVELLRKRLDLSWSSYLESLVPAALGGLVMYMVVRGFQEIGYSFWHLYPIWRLTSSILLGGVVYLTTLFVVRALIVRPLLLEAFGEIEGLLRLTVKRMLRVITGRYQWQKA